MAKVRQRERSVTSELDNDVSADLEGTERPRNHRPEENVALSDPMSWYPPVTPPTKSKKDIFRLEEFKDIDAKAKNVSRDFIRNSRDLVSYLTAGLTSDLEKARSVFSWMGAQQMAMASPEDYSSHPSPNSPEFFLKEAAEGKRDAFATLFALLCRKAGVACMIVRGLVKAAAYDPGVRATCGTSTWTIVHVQHGWQFVYPLWAFRFVQNYSRGVWTEIEDVGHSKWEKQIRESGEVKGHVDEFWFLTDPEDFNFLCHADENEDRGAKQLLSEPWSTEMFLGLPGLKVDYFKSPWKLLSPNTAVVQTTKGKCSIDFQHPKTSKAELRYKLFFSDTTSKKQESLTLQSENIQYVTRLKSGKGVLSLVTRLPVIGLYKLEVSGVLDNGDPYLLGQFCLQCTEVMEKPKPFPSNPENGFGFDETSEAAGIHNPSRTEGVQLVKKGQALNFDFEVDDEHEQLMPQLKHGLRSDDELACHVTINRNHKHVSIGVHLPADDADPEYSLEIYVGGKRNSGSPSKESTSDSHKAGTSRNGSTDGGRHDRHGKDKSASEGDEQRDQSSPTDFAKSSEIHNSYKRGNSTLDPVSSASSSPRDSGFAESEISNSYKGGNSQLDPVGQDDKYSGSSMGLFVNALNYLLTADKQLHDESSIEKKELHQELLEALDNGKQSTIRDALQHFLAAGLDNPIAVAKAKAKERVWEETCMKLEKAKEEKSMSSINRVIGDFKANKMDDAEALRPAVDRLMSLSERTIKSAMASQSIPQLDSALKRVRSSHVGKRARATDWFREAQALRTNTAIRGPCDEVASKLKTTVVVGLGMEDKPVSRQLQKMLLATLILLGDEEEALKDSRSIKNRVRETNAGRSQLLGRIKNFNVEQTTKNHVIKAEKALACCNAKELEKDSGPAARSLHDWCQRMVKELSYHIWDDGTDDSDDDFAS